MPRNAVVVDGPGDKRILFRPRQNTDEDGPNGKLIREVSDDLRINLEGIAFDSQWYA